VEVHNGVGVAVALIDVEPMIDVEPLMDVER
jgi:hypothetical protein